MAKRTISEIFSIADTTAWRARVSEISNALTAVGFPKTADTGQIDPATTTLPGAGASGGYEVRYLNDALHTTAPVFLRIDYFRNSGGGLLSTRVTMGTGTNGAGTITGLNTGVIDPQQGFSPGRAVARPSYFAADSGYAWMAYGAGAGLPVNPWIMNTWMVCRTVDAAGEISADGVALYYSLGLSLRRRVISRLSNSVYAEDAAYSMVVGGLTNTETGTGPQVYRHWAHTPSSRRLRHLATYVNPEISEGSVLSLPVVGAAIDYLALGPLLGNCSVQQLPAHCILLAWTGPTV